MLEYSTLNPETNSDSLSVKSNDTLLVSAKADTKNIIVAGNNGVIYHSLCKPDSRPSLFNRANILNNLRFLHP